MKEIEVDLDRRYLRTDRGPELLSETIINAIDLAADHNQITYITENGKRIAQIGPTGAIAEDYVWLYPPQN